MKTRTGLMVNPTFTSHNHNNKKEGFHVRGVLGPIITCTFTACCWLDTGNQTASAVMHKQREGHIWVWPALCTLICKSNFLIGF